MPNWPITDHLPGNATVTAYFVGLMAFCYNRDRQCEIGFFGTANHSLSVEIYRNFKKIFPLEKANGKGRKTALDRGNLELYITEKVEHPLVKFFQGDDFDTETRMSGDNNDFRWLLDLESRGIEIRKHKFDELLPWKLFVSHGTFFTFLPTCSTFVDASETFPFGHMARVVAANIHIEKDQTLTLTVPDGSQPDPIKPKPGITYQIVFDNECRKEGEPCEHSDFEEIFELLLDVPPFNLKCADDNSSQAPENPLPIPKSKVRRESNDATPCMGAAFGESGGFP